VHDTVEKTWRHVDFFQDRALLHARLPQVRCPEHGVRQVSVPWARPGSGFTLLFEALVCSFRRGDADGEGRAAAPLLWTAPDYSARPNSPRPHRLDAPDFATGLRALRTLTGELAAGVCRPAP